MSSMDNLIGVVQGVVADGQLTDLEVQFLRTWLDANSHLQAMWPASAVCLAVKQVLADGVVTEDERVALLTTLVALAGGDTFAETGSVTPGATTLPTEDDGPLTLAGQTICFTGNFVFGARSACARAAVAAGADVVDSVTRKLTLLVIGQNVSAGWAHTTYGRKIQQAVALRDEAGLPVRIVSERRWTEALSAPQ